MSAHPPTGRLEGHRHGHAHEHDHEPQPGLPERLPAHEHLLWQGAPDWKRLAIQAFHVRKVAAYFGVLMALRGLFVWHDGGTVTQALVSALWLAPVALIGLGLLAVLAWLSAHNTIYTLTDRRVVMRIGIVLTVTFNLPYKRIVGADLARGPHGSGDVSLQLHPADRIGYIHLWPHVRPWRFGRPQPTLRALADVEQVAGILTRAWAARTGEAALGATTGATAGPAPAQPGNGHAPVLATR